MRALLRFLFLAAVKALSRLFFRFVVEWVGERPAAPFERVRILILLNHTSLFEPVFAGLAPPGWLWRVAHRGLLPGADSTLKRPVAGTFFKWMVPDCVSVTRNRDWSWRDFLSRIDEEDTVIMAPEGRMKRRTGLDKYGKPMTMRGGIADVLDRKKEGDLLILYSGGLHHVQAPGEGFPHLFKTIKARFEILSIARYKALMGYGTPAFRENVMADLERRRDLHCRWG